MYVWIWRRLPGSTGLRAALSVVLVLALVALLFLAVFPAVEPLLPFNATTVGN